jgi:glycosyltransferase involved in cell wall biosynthesis
MPLCHNLIEAMAAGAIPILQYGDYLPHPLKDGVNCLAFKDTNSLRAITQAVLTLNNDRVCELRANVLAYYKEFLAPGCFARQLFSGPQRERTLLVNAYRVPRK